MTAVRVQVHGDERARVVRQEPAAHLLGRHETAGAVASWNIRRSEDGFTLVEMLVTTVMALVVFAVTLSILLAFNHGSQTVTQQSDSQNTARLGVDRIVRQLRNIASTPGWGSPVERATPDDLVFQTIAPASAGVSPVAERVRYCITSHSAPESSNALILQTQPTSEANPWPASSGEISCPDPAYLSSVVVGDVTNQAVFSYDSTTAASDPATVRSIGIDLFVDPMPGDTNNVRESELRSSATLRNAGPVAAFTATPKTSGTVLLNAGASRSPSGDTLSYAWSCAPAPTACSSTGSAFDWSPGPGLYTVTLTVTDQAGLDDIVEHQVTVS